MRIQATNTFYTGAYSVLNTKSLFPYAVKVEGYGNTRNQKSLFQFAHVTITEHMLNAKYGTKITNGPRVQMQTAVALGKMELPTDEKKCNPDRAVKEAFEVLVRDQAAPQNSWSNTLYSEDGKYTFTMTESGRWQMHLLDDVGMEASVEDIANWMMSGTPNRNIETRYLTNYKN